MKYKSIVILIVIYTLLWPTIVFSRQCDRNEYDKAEYFSEKAGQKLVEKYGGGNNIRVTMRSCNYNTYSGIFKTKLEIYWNGLVRSSREYNIDGVLKMTSEGTESEWSETFANSNVKKLRFWGYIAGGAVFIGVLVNENE